jgi:hypothetical protein
MRLRVKFAQQKIVKKILICVKGMMDYTLCYHGEDLRLVGNSDVIATQIIN